MISSFWTNTIWYILLGISTIIVLTVTIYKAQRRRLAIAFYITILGIVLNFETIILIFLKSYVYYPKILTTVSNPFDDVLAGNLFSQFSVASTVLLVVIFNLNYYWYVILAIIYGAVEELFLALGIYSHNWYKTWITVTMIPLAFYLAKKMYGTVDKGISPIYYYGYIYFGLFSLYVITLLWGLQVIGIIGFSTTFLEDATNSWYFLVIIIFFIPHTIAMMTVYFSDLKTYWKVLIIAFLYLYIYIYYKMGLFWIKDGQFVLVSTITIVWVYFSVMILDKLYDGNKRIIIE